MRKAVARFALTVEHIAFGTAKGPMRFVEPVESTDWCAARRAEVEGPPEPAIRPVRSWLTSASDSPASAMACSMAMWA